MKKTTLFTAIFVFSQPVWAETSNHISAAPTLAKMFFGLLAVLAVMMLIAWLLKRAMPNGLGQSAVAKIVGGVSVGSRERVVVVEVGGRWIVVGVAPGQVTSLANIEQGAKVDQVMSVDQSVSTASTQTVSIPPFSQWLNNSFSKFKR